MGCSQILLDGKTGFKQENYIFYNIYEILININTFV